MCKRADRHGLGMGELEHLRPKQALLHLRIREGTNRGT